MKLAMVELTREITSPEARRLLSRALEDAGVLTSSAGALGSKQSPELERRVAAEPEESFETERFADAFQRAIDMVESEHGSVRRHATVVLVLFGLAVLVTLYLAVTAMRQQHSTEYVKALIASVPSGALLLWYRYLTATARRLREDMMKMAHVRSGMRSSPKTR
jgi:hypothetical protein